MSVEATLSSADRPPLARTPLFDLHVAAGARMVAFAGYDMPVQYRDGVLHEHNHTRTRAGLFDVSHMGQARLIPTTGAADAAALMERLVPGGISTLDEGRIRYTVLTNAEGGIRDDLMVTRFGDTVWLVVNAACKTEDFSYIADALDGHARLEVQDRALVALQGPRAAAILQGHIEAIADLTFMQARWVDWHGHALLVSRCGYTGEDGFEISLPPETATQFSAALLGDADVELIGLGARDSLRLEAGLCLYGHDIDIKTSPAEADLLWTIPKRRRDAADYPGAALVGAHIASGAPRYRVGLLPEGRAPAREGTEICAPDGTVVGMVTSGGFSPTLGRPVAMGYVHADFAAPDTSVHLMVRGRALPARVSTMPFVPHQYARGTK
ncbi:MAG TPA: glycine cleavage system aminomethyltransferase GcvT [Rhodobiaceae bacterium]|jgi:aminomethyltransferase|nr:glycine cleavage system aminomethyltransferase GcvT [Rhodobiaceae bacterium]